jgi:lysophospholipase L1-like esterase
MRRSCLIPAFRVARFGVIAAIAGIVLMTSNASTATTEATATSGDRRAFVIGDSVLVGAQGALAARLGASGWQVTQVAAESQHTYDAPGVIDANAGAIGDVVVVSLGANDGITPGLFAGWIDGLMDRLRSVPRVYWVNLRQFAPWVPAANAEIAAAMDRWPNLRQIDWAARASSDPTLVYGDGIHLTAAGVDAYAELIGSTLDEDASMTATTTTTTTTTTTPRRQSRSDPRSTSPSSTAFAVDSPSPGDGGADWLDGVWITLGAAAGLLIGTGLIALSRSRAGNQASLRRRARST